MTIWNLLLLRDSKMDLSKESEENVLPMNIENIVAIKKTDDASEKVKKKVFFKFLSGVLLPNPPPPSPYFS